MQGVSVLGSTGSIGVNTLDVLARHTERFKVVALAAYSQVDRLLEQCQRFEPALVAVGDEVAGERFAERAAAAGVTARIVTGIEGVRAVATHAEAGVVMAAIVGAAGLVPTLDAVRAGKRVLLANKEPLVMVGDLIVREAAVSGAVLLPIDSEHNAIFQCLPHGYRVNDADSGAAGLSGIGVRRILLTGSGGPFRTRRIDELHTVTPAEACAHPNWSMGRKISVDSATMMNKGLELIEACRLFRASPDEIEIVVHPQSVVHSMVEYVDGSVLAQLGNPDMRTPIAHALAWPQRIDAGVRSLDIVKFGQLDFEAPDMARFPCLRLADQAARVGGSCPAILNAANEEAVDAFLDGALGFTDIPRVIEDVLAEVCAGPADTLEQVLSADRRARDAAREHIAVSECRA